MKRSDRLLTWTHEGKPRQRAAVALVMDLRGDTSASMKDLLLELYGTVLSELPDVGEARWVKAKANETAMPELDISRTGNELCHDIFWATDFSRSKLVDAAAVAKVEDELAACEDAEQTALYKLALVCLSQTPDVSDQEAWFDACDDLSTHAAWSHATLLASVGD